MLGNGKKVIALIPARKGSKGVKRKNIRTISGRALIDFTIQAAKTSRFMDGVYVSSDDEEIVKIAREADIEIVHRPAEFSSDTATANDVVNHFISALPESIREQDPYIVYLQPTSPLRSHNHIDSALGAMERFGMHTLVSVCELMVSPYKSFRIDREGTLQSLFDEKMSNARRQDLPHTYIPNGAIYTFRISDFVGRNGFPSNGSLPFIMSPEDSVDIDTEDDIRLVEQIIGRSYG